MPIGGERNLKLPSSFMKTVTGVHKEKGRIWMEQFDGLIRYCEDRWSLQMLPPFSLSYNFAAPVRFRDGSEAVLKLGVPSREFRLEAEALRMFNGRGAVRVIDADMERGIMLLERLKPGHTLDSVQDDDEAVGIAADLMRRLHVPAPAGSAFPTTVIWAEGLKRLRAHYQGGTGPLPEPLVQKRNNGLPSCTPLWAGRSCFTAICITATFCPRRGNPGSPSIRRG
jgi:streptomycin 6-kinase